ncbi:MAG: hypothetical protein LBP30_01555 [Clostridiales Family XIII bacterium]|nr:hypothetical protein [Clostridiales Family XIII bacterium]
MPSVITHKLALALRFSDAIDGRIIENDIQCSIDGKQRRPAPKSGGYFAFLTEDLPEESFDLEVRASGYVPTKKRVLLEAPGIGPPLLNIELIPEENPLLNVNFDTISGKREGLAALDAVRQGENSCFVGSFDARKRRLSVYNPHRLELNRVRYALVDPNGLSYEPFVIEERVAGGAFRIDHPFIASVSEDRPIAPLIGGEVRTDGTYLLRVRNEGADKRWIVRFAEAEGDRFELVDFDNPETLRFDDGRESARPAKAPRKASGKASGKEKKN